MKYLSLFRVISTENKFDESHVFHETRYRSIHILFPRGLAQAALVAPGKSNGEVSLFFGFP